jgi:hypothetical protein
MIDLAEALKAEPLVRKPLVGIPLVAKRPVAKKTFTMQGLRRVMVWGAVAAGALLIAVITGRSEGAAERIAFVLHPPKQVATQQFDAQAETQRLAETLRGLAASDEQIKSRLAAAEHDINDVTGSITQQLKAADTTRRSDDGPSVAATAAMTAAMVAPVAVPAAAVASSPPGAIKTSVESALPALAQTEFGVDIGSGLTIQALRTRWAAIRTAHPQLFDGLEPIVSVKEVPRTNRIELRLVAGPIAQAGTAAQLCAQLSLLGLFCQPTMFDGQRLALR